MFAEEDRRQEAQNPVRSRRWLDVPDCEAHVTEVLHAAGAIEALVVLNDAYQLVDAVDRAARRSVQEIRRDALAAVPETGDDDRNNLLEFYRCAAKAREDWRTLLGHEGDAANASANFASIVLFCGRVRKS